MGHDDGLVDLNVVGYVHGVALVQPQCLTQYAAVVPETVGVFVDVLIHVALDVKLVTPLHALGVVVHDCVAHAALYAYVFSDFDVLVFRLFLQYHECPVSQDVVVYKHCDVLLAQLLLLQ